MDKRLNFEKIYNDYKDYLFPILFYISGLFIGVFLYSNTNIDSIISNIISSQGTSFLSLFTIKLSVYISLISITILLGLCLIGFPFINVIPLLIGIEISLKIAYYYASFGAKGIGYSILLIIPEASSFFTVLIYTIKNGNELSKFIYDSTIKKSDIVKDDSLKQYLKLFLLYTLIVIIISAINALAVFLLNPIIKI